MRISSRILPLLAGLAACSGWGSTFTDRQAMVTVDSAEVALVAPDGLCFDARSIDVTPSGAFLVMADCALTRASATTTAPLGLFMKASVSEERPPSDMSALESFLTQPPGIFAIGKSGEPDKISVLSSEIEDGILLIKVRDEGRLPSPTDSAMFWRGFFGARDRLIGVTITGFQGTAISDTEAQSLIRSFAQRTRAANQEVEKI